MPRALRLHLLFGRGPGLFFLASILVGLFFVVGSLVDSEPLHGPAYDRETVGVVLDVEDESDEDGQSYVVTAMYDDDEGQHFLVRSYTDSKREEKERVNVKFEHAHPDHAVIDGGRTHDNSWYSPILAIGFVGLWLAGAFASTRNQRIALRLLPHGVVADGKVVEKIENSDGEGTTWTTRFEFTTLGNRTSSCEVETNRESPYAKGQTYPILYDAGWPDRATPLAHLAGAPTIGADGRIAYTGSSLRMGLIVTMIAASVYLASILPFAFAQWW